MGRPARHLAFALALCAGAKVLPAARADERDAEPVPAAPRAGGRVDPALVVRVCELLRAPADGTLPVQEEVSAALAGLGPSAVPTLFAFLTGDALEALGERPAELGWAAGDEEQPGWTSRDDKIILDALSTMPGAAVLAELGAQALGADRPLAVRMVALRVLEHAGRADGLPLWFDLLGEIEPVHEMRPYVQAPFEKALEAMLRGDRRSFADVEGRLRGRVPTELAIVARSVGRSGQARGLALLEPLVARTSELDVLVLEEVARLARGNPSILVDDALAWLRPLLDSPDEATRTQAVQTLAELEDTASVPDIIVRLEDESRRVRRAAQTGLEKFSGLRLGAETGPWKLWFGGQLRWLETEGARLRVALASNDRGEVVRALGTLGQRRLFRDELVEPLLEALWRDDVDVVVAACAALGQLGSRRALAPLVETLRDPEARIREGAWKALRALTHEDEGPEYEGWAGLLAQR